MYRLINNKTKYETIKLRFNTIISGFTGIKL